MERTDPTQPDDFDYTKPDDSVIRRNRFGRTSLFFGTSAMLLGTAYAGGSHVASMVISDNLLAPKIAGLTSLLIGAYLVKELARVSVIQNTTTQMFLTIDTLRSSLGWGDVSIPYGPGLHFCYPWEARIAENVISLKESSVKFSFSVQCQDGLLEGTGSFRIRADQKNSVAFITGIAAVGEDLIDLIIVAAIDTFAGVKVIDATQLIPPLNNKLREVITDGVSDFEKRFGVIVGDATISELLPTADVQKTLSALTEAAAIRKGIGILLGMEPEEVRTSRENGTLSEAAYDRARRDFLSISGNLEGMNITRKEIDLSFSGVSPKAAKVLKKLAQQAGPAIAAFADAVTNDKGKNG